MTILFVMDPVETCDLKWDNSLRLLSEFNRRGHHCWTADTIDLHLDSQRLFGKCRRVESFPAAKKTRRPFDYRPVQTKLWDLCRFDLILIRKDPPFDQGYIYLTYLLEKIADRVPMVNHPRGIRNNNEKLSILRFPKWIPRTLVTSSPAAILTFQEKLSKPVVVKPLHLRSGKGIFILKKSTPFNLSRLRRLTDSGRITVMAQEFLKVRAGEKRVVLLGGNFLCAYEKRARKNDFRANLNLGASFHKTTLSAQEKKLCRDLKPYLLQEGLWFAGLDILDGKLLEINVTSPAGVTEAIHLWQEPRFVEAWADFLEDFSRR